MKNTTQQKEVSQPYAMPAFWALGLDRSGLLYAKAFQDHDDAQLYKECMLKNSDCKRVSVTTKKVYWETVLDKLTWQYSGIHFTTGD